MNSERRIRNRVRVSLGFALVGAAVSVVSSEIGEDGAAAAPLGGVTFTPPEGSFSLPTEFSAAAACPDSSTRYKITIAGAGLSNETNMTGTETFPEGIKQVEGIALSAGTFEEFANQAGVTLSGAATVAIKCISGLSTIDAEFSSPVTFSGTGAATTYASGGAGASPTPGASTTPTPSPGASTTPTPSPEATATPDPDPDEATPTPTPDADTDTDTDTSGAGGAGGDDDSAPLPNTGGQDPQRILTIAALFGLTGWLITLFEGASRPRKDWS